MFFVTLPALLLWHLLSCKLIFYFSQVKALYVKNIPENTSTETLREIFQRHGEVIKVVMPPGKGGQGKRDFGFVHYAERSSALKAVRDSEKYEIDGMFYTPPLVLIATGLYFIIMGLYI